MEYTALRNIIAKYSPAERLHEIESTPLKDELVCLATAETHPKLHQAFMKALNACNLHFPKEPELYITKEALTAQGGMIGEHPVVIFGFGHATDLLPESYLRFCFGHELGECNFDVKYPKLHALGSRLGEMGIQHFNHKRELYCDRMGTRATGNAEELLEFLKNTEQSEEKLPRLSKLRQSILPSSAYPNKAKRLEEIEAEQARTDNWAERHLQRADARDLSINRHIK